MRLGNWVTLVRLDTFNTLSSSVSLLFMLRLSLRQRQKKPLSQNLNRPDYGQHLRPTLPALRVLRVLPMRWYLMLSTAVHVLLLGIGLLYFAFMPPPEAKKLPLALSLVNLPELPSVETPVQMAEVQMAKLTPEIPESIQAEVVKPVNVSQVPKKTQPEPTKPEKPDKLEPVLAEKVEKKLEEELPSYYPDAYVSRRLVGEVLLRLSIEPGTGKVLTIRVERPSPHGLFNDAAREAVMALMPTVSPNLPTEVLLPVRFRLGR